VHSFRGGLCERSASTLLTNRPRTPSADTGFACLRLSAASSLGERVRRDRVQCLDRWRVLVVEIEVDRDADVASDPYLAFDF